MPRDAVGQRTRLVRRRYSAAVHSDIKLHQHRQAGVEAARGSREIVHTRRIIDADRNPRRPASAPSLAIFGAPITSLVTNTPVTPPPSPCTCGSTMRLPA